MEAVGHSQDLPRGRHRAVPEQLQGILNVLPGVAGVVLQYDVLPVYTVLHQIVVHALGLAHGLIRALSPGDHHRHVRVVLQVGKGGVQPVPEELRGPPGLYLAAEDDHDLRLLLPLSDLRPGAGEHHRLQGGEGDHGQGQQRQQDAAQHPARGDGTTCGEAVEDQVDAPRRREGGEFLQAEGGEQEHPQGKGQQQDAQSHQHAAPAAAPLVGAVRFGIHSAFASSSSALSRSQTA